VDSFGNVFVADFGNSSIRMIDLDGFVTTLQCVKENGEPYKFISPVALCIDTSGIYVAEQSKHVVCKIHRPTCWNHLSHKYFPRKMKRGLIILMMLWRKKSNGTPIHPTALIHCLPKDVLNIIFQFFMSNK